MKIKFTRNIRKMINNKTGEIKKRFNNLVIDFDWTYFKKIMFEIRNPVLFYKKMYEKSERMNTELLVGSHRKKNKVTHQYIYRFLFFYFVYIKIEVMRKTELRKIFKRMGFINGT